MIGNIDNSNTLKIEGNSQPNRRLIWPGHIQRRVVDFLGSDDIIDIPIVRSWRYTDLIAMALTQEQDGAGWEIEDSDQFDIVFEIEGPSGITTIVNPTNLDYMRRGAVKMVVYLQRPEGVEDAPINSEILISAAADQRQAAEELARTIELSLNMSCPFKGGVFDFADNMRLLNARDMLGGWSDLVVPQQLRDSVGRHVEDFFTTHSTNGASKNPAMPNVLIWDSAFVTSTTLARTLMDTRGGANCLIGGDQHLPQDHLDALYREAAERSPAIVVLDLACLPADATAPDEYWPYKLTHLLRSLGKLQKWQDILTVAVNRRHPMFAELSSCDGPFQYEPEVMSVVPGEGSGSGDGRLLGCLEDVTGMQVRVKDGMPIFSWRWNS